jgi:hypothetical protein
MNIAGPWIWNYGVSFVFWDTQPQTSNLPKIGTSLNQSLMDRGLWIALQNQFLKTNPHLLIEIKTPYLYAFQIQKFWGQ